MDPLSLLREFNVNNDLSKVYNEGDRVQFGDRYSFAKSVLTAYKSQSGKGDFYTLDALLFFLQNKKLNAQEYIKQAREHNVPQVNFIDRKLLLQYLEGEIEASAVPHIAEADALPLNIFSQPASATAAQKRERAPDDEGGPLKVLLSQERQLRNRNSMLLAPNRDFSKVLTILKQVEQKIRMGGHSAPSKTDHRHSGHHGSHHSSHQHHHSSSQHHHSSSHHRHSSSSRQPEQARVGGAIPVKPSNRYERDATGDHLRAMGGEAAAALGAVIDIYGTKGGGDAPSTSGAPPKGPSGSAPPVNARPGSGAPGGARVSSGHGASGGKSGSRGSASGVPIIIVPAGLSTLLNMYNAPQFLERGSFITSEAARQGAPKQTQVAITVNSHRDNKPRMYIVTDKAPDRKSSDWTRVVAVICQGAKWQFKDWPFKGAATGDLVETFSKVAGYYFHYADEKVPEVATTWNVKYLPMPRESRNQDITIRLDFFKHLEVFMAARKAGSP